MEAEFTPVYAGCRFKKKNPGFPVHARSFIAGQAGRLPYKLAAYQSHSQMTKVFSPAFFPVIPPCRMMKEKIQGTVPMLPPDDPDGSAASSFHGGRWRKAETGTFHQQTGKNGYYAVPGSRTHAVPETRSRRPAGFKERERFLRRGKTGSPPGFPSPLSSCGNLKSWRTGNVLGLPRSSGGCYSATHGSHGWHRSIQGTVQACVLIWMKRD